VITPQKFLENLQVKNVNFITTAMAVTRLKNEQHIIGRLAWKKYIFKFTYTHTHTHTESREMIKVKVIRIDKIVCGYVCCRPENMSCFPSSSNRVLRTSTRIVIIHNTKEEA